MDLSVDITSAVHEVVEKRPDLSWQEAARSGLNVGRAAMGTMTTTLVLAYSGGYIALLMVFMAQGTPVDHILNYKYVAAEDHPHRHRLLRSGHRGPLHRPVRRTFPGPARRPSSAPEGVRRMIRRNHLLSTGVLLLECLPMLPGF